MMNIEIARQQMIEQQVRAWEVLDPDVLAVFNDVPREQFAPRDYRALAFSDIEIPIGYGHAMMTPTVEGRVLQSLELTGTENILEIGTGTGFLTACLAALGAHVTSVELHPKLLKRASENLADAGVDNVELLQMDAMQSLPAGPFDAVVVTGSLYRLDTRFVEALTDGGRLFVIVGEAPVMEARRIRRTGGSDWAGESLFETCVAPLDGAGAPPRFSF